MPTVSLGQIYADVRGILNDTQIPTGEVFTNNYFILNPNAFGEAYRSMFSRMIGGSKRVQRVVYVVLPAQTTVLIPQTYGIVDFSDPEMIEERPAVGPGIAITGTSTTTPIVVTAPAHGLGPTGNMVPGQICNVIGTSSPWGNWYVTVIDANSFSLNGSMSDGVAGTGGLFFPQSSQPWSEVTPIDLSFEGLDGQPSSCLGNYLWIDEMLQFRGASQATQLRLTYYASGTAPTDPNFIVGIDNSRDFLSIATASNCAYSLSWYTQAERLRNRAYGDPTHPDEPSLLDLFWNSQVLALQRGPSRRQLPFRNRRSRWGSWIGL